MSTSGYFEHWRGKGASKPSRPGAHKRISDEALLVHIRAIHAEVKHEYGWPKMCKELLARGIRVGKARVQKTMQRHGIKARGKRKFVVTTDSKHDLPIAPNLLARNFTTEAPNQTWTSDITYIATDEGWLYVALVLDLYARKLVGWAMSETMPQELTLCALDGAKAGGHPLATPVNRHKQNPTTEVVFPSLPNLSSQPLSSPHTWFSIIGCAVAHQSPIRIKALSPCDAWPLAALAAPENLLFPTASI